MSRLMFMILTAISVWAVSAQAQDVQCPEGYVCTVNENNSSVSSDSTTRVESPPPSAIAPTINSSNSDLCTIGVAGAVQTQILGISAGTVFTEENCLRLKNAKVLYDMGMKVAAVSTMCQDPKVFDAMMNAGTPCPYDGLIGDAAKTAWLANKDKQPENENKSKNPLANLDEDDKTTAMGVGAIGGLLLLLLF